LTTARIEKAWPAIGTLQDMLITRDGHGDFGGRILTAKLQGTAGSVLVPGDDLRTLLGDDGRSTWFQLEPVQPRRGDSS
jgi:hypothetical protein